MPAQPALPVVPIGGAHFTHFLFLFYRAREHKTIYGRHLLSFWGAITAQSPQRRFRVLQPPLEVGVQFTTSWGLPALLSFHTVQKKAYDLTPFNQKVNEHQRQLRKATHRYRAHRAATGGTPITSLVPASVVRTQYANLSHDTITQFTAEKFDEVPVHQAQLGRPGGRVALNFNNGVFEADGAGVRREFPGPTSSSPASQHARDCHGIFPAAKRIRALTMPPRGLGSRGSPGPL